MVLLCSFKGNNIQLLLCIPSFYLYIVYQQPLQPPIVACGLGKLYNQDAILEYILDKKAYGDGDRICSHINSPKDTVKLNLTPNPAYDEVKNAQDSATMGHLDKDVQSRFICPVSMKEMNGKHRFVYLDTCGCAFAEQSLKEIKTQECVSCGKPFTQDNIIVINPQKEELDRMKAILKEKKAKAKAERKAKKAAAKEAGVPTEKKRKRDIDESLSSPVQKGLPAPKKMAMNSTAAAVMGKVSQELAEKEKNKKEASSAIKSIYAKKDIKGNYLTMGTFNRYA